MCTPRKETLTENVSPDLNLLQSIPMGILKLLPKLWSSSSFYWNTKTKCPLWVPNGRLTNKNAQSCDFLRHF